MKVIKKGREQIGWARELECTGKGNGNGGCGAILLVEQDDVFSTRSHYYDGSTEYCRTFECPECEVLTDLDIDEYIPFDIPTRSEWLKEQKIKKLEAEKAK